MIAQLTNGNGTIRRDELWVARQLARREKAGKLPVRRGGYVVDETGNVVYEPDAEEIQEQCVAIRGLRAERVAQRAVLRPLERACYAMFGVKDV